MNLKEKDGSKFWGCPNWQKCGGKTQRYVAESPKQAPKNPQTAKTPSLPQKPPTTQPSANQVHPNREILTQSEILGEILMLVTGIYRKVQFLEEKLNGEIFNEEPNEELQATRNAEIFNQ